jgi:hypothetical protein
MPSGCVTVHADVALEAGTILSLGVRVAIARQTGIESPGCCGYDDTWRLISLLLEPQPEPDALRGATMRYSGHRNAASPEHRLYRY